MREKKKETLKNCLIVIGFYISFIVFAIVSHKREAQEENQYHSRANFYLVGDIKKIIEKQIIVDSKNRIIYDASTGLESRSKCNIKQKN